MVFNDFVIVFVAYIIIKIGYLISFSSLFHLLSLKGKKLNGTYIDKFTRTSGFTLIFLGIVTGSLVVFKKFFPNYYIYAYLSIIFASLIFLLIKFNSYKNFEKDLLNNG